MSKWYNVVVCTMDGKDKDFKEAHTENLKSRNFIHLPRRPKKKNKKNTNALGSSVSSTKVTWSSMSSLQPMFVDYPMDSRISYKEVGAEC